MSDITDADTVDSQTQRFLHDELVTISLEGRQEKFSVSKALLCSSSDYFKKAVSGSFTESSTRTLTLPGCDLETFRLFVSYLTSGLASGTFYCGLQVSVTDRQSQLQFIKLWIFADAYLMPKLQNSAIDCLIDSLQRSVVDVEAIAYAFQHTAVGSPLRDVVVTEAMHDLENNGFDDDEIDGLGAIPGFLKALVARQNQCGEHDCPRAGDHPCVPSTRLHLELGLEQWHVKV